MNVTEIRRLARHHSIRPLPRTKLGLVRAIQTREGNFPCFATAYDAVCDQSLCLWRDDCFKASRETASAGASRF